MLLLPFHTGLSLFITILAKVPEQAEMRGINCRCKVCTPKSLCS